MVQAKSLDEVQRRLYALEDCHDHYEADMLLCDALLLCGGDDVVTAYLEARERCSFGFDKE